MGLACTAGHLLGWPWAGLEMGWPGYGVPGHGLFRPWDLLVMGRAAHGLAFRWAELANGWPSYGMV
jgi:hypothetical protein